MERLHLGNKLLSIVRMPICIFSIVHPWSSLYGSLDGSTCRQFLWQIGKLLRPLKEEFYENPCPTTFYIKRTPFHFMSL